MLDPGEGHRPGEIVRLRFGLSFSYVVKRGQAVEFQTTWVSPTLNNSSYRANWFVTFGACVREVPGSNFG